MLEGSFYTVLQSQAAAENYAALLSLNAAHPVFEGHFPGQPVVPGVCMMQTIQESLERCLQCKVQLQKANIMKFLVLIDPVVQPQVNVELKYALQPENTVKVTAAIKHEGTVFMKFQGTFKISN
ncbi:3-hydroxyacyl-ACP dehydratase [Chitinophaga agrisoli]|uniref:3-hydroxyacyl-ACP dehydratase n=1 Tax=Chitinophaga agrisoli TaxID=2607653 RepID=A0A5B2VS17_9BACT|nr:3-hydroxyacyl-ACP dehydratase [Chitinophaga agrisoli]KAA2241815.1 3-hydroxyacyl-ACP dehydratase [Chitinophaga agrisoli]